MLLNELLCEVLPSFEESFFYCLEEDFCYQAEKCGMDILCQFCFGCMVHNVICHNFLLLCLKGNFPRSYLLLPGAFWYLLSIFQTGISCLSSVRFHPSSDKIPDDISASVFTFGIM